MAVPHLMFGADPFGPRFNIVMLRDSHYMATISEAPAHYGIYAGSLRGGLLAGATM